MPKCPNCGRDTYRTEDWACQWCGHPLLYGAFKRVPKTFRQIQEERGYSPEPDLGDEPELVQVAKAKPAATPPPPSSPPPQMSEPEPEPEIEPEIPSPPEPVAEVATEAEVKGEAITSEPEAEAAVKEEATTMETKEARPAEPQVATAPAPVAVPSLEPKATTGVVTATVEELNAAFNSDKAGANAKLLDKALKVAGTVDKVFVRDNLDIFYIILAGAGGPSTKQVRCTFNREHGAHLSRLTEGQKATVQGVYAGYERNIILKDCSLVP